MDKKQRAALNMAKFIKGQSLELLGRLEDLEMDERAEQCERLHEQAEALLEGLSQELSKKHPPLGWILIDLFLFGWN
jgi:hypothetical protein